MKTQTLLAFLLSHIHCNLVLLAAPLSPMGTLDLGTGFAGPSQTSQGNHDFHLSRNDDGEFMSPDVTDRLELAYPMSHGTFGYSDGSLSFKELSAKSLTGARQAGDSVSPLQRSARSRSLVDRMPLSFGKREPTTTGRGAAVLSQRTDKAIKIGISDADDCRTTDGLGRCIYLVTPQVSTSLDSPYFLQEKPSELLSGPSGFERVLRARLDRMPLTFGKRTPEVEEDQQHAESTRSDRDLDKLLQIRARDSMLDRMPNYYGRKKKSLRAQEILGLPRIGVFKNPISNERSAYTRLSDVTNEQNVLDGHDSETRGTFETKRTSRMDRMPLTFGKRNHENEKVSKDINLHEILQQLLKATKLSGKYNRTYWAEKDKFGKQLAPRIKVLLPLHIAKLLGLRSSPSHGRQEILEHSKNLKDNDNVDIDLQSKLMQLSSQPIADQRENPFKTFPQYEKRSSFSVLIRHLQKHKDTLPPAEYKRLQAHAHTLLKKYFLVNAPLTRSSRSRLGRMPLTFGKRQSDRAQVYSRSGQHISLPLQGRRPFLLQLTRRSRMDRMPLAFGKRSTSASRHVKSPSGEINRDFYATLSSLAKGTFDAARDADDSLQRTRLSNDEHARRQQSDGTGEIPENNDVFAGDGAESFSDVGSGSSVSDESVATHS